MQVDACAMRCQSFLRMEFRIRGPGSPLLHDVVRLLVLHQTKIDLDILLYISLSLSLYIYIYKYFDIFLVYVLMYFC